MGKKRCIQNVGWKDLAGRGMTDLHVDGEDNIRMDVMEIGWEGVEWMHTARERDQWRVLLNTVMNLRVP
jgi:hypothetical protein